MGHESSALALEMHAKVMERKRETGSRMDELVRGADWAQMGTSGPVEVLDVLPSGTKKPPERRLSKLRGKDSNLDYLIQSQASYH